jgi:hypothetical protein
MRSLSKILLATICTLVPLCAVHVSPSRAVELSELQADMKSGRCPANPTRVELLKLAEYCQSERECGIQSNHKGDCKIQECLQDMNRQNSVVNAYNSWLRKNCKRTAQDQQLPQRSIPNGSDEHGGANSTTGFVPPNSDHPTAKEFRRDFEKITREAKRKSDEAAKSIHAERNRLNANAEKIKNEVYQREQAQRQEAETARQHQEQADQEAEQRRLIEAERERRFSIQQRLDEANRPRLESCAKYSFYANNMVSNNFGEVCRVLLRDLEDRGLPPCECKCNDMRCW